MLIIVGALTVGALLAAGCSDGSTSGGSGGGGGNGLTNGLPTTAAAALALIPRTAWDAGYVEFGDTAQVISMNGGTGSGPLFAYLGLGETSLYFYSGNAVSTLGFDPLKVTLAVSVGTLPQQATILYGDFDVASIGTKLAAAGFKQDGAVDGGTVWAFATNGQVNMGNPIGDPELNVLQVFPNKIIYGLSAALVEALAAPATTPLSTNSALAALATCLGSAKAGLIGAVPTTGSRSTPTLGIGMLADSAQNANEELCLIAPRASDASGMATNWTKQIQTGRSTRLNEPWSKVLTNPRSTTLSGSPTLVRLTAQPAAGANAGTLLQAYDSSGLSPLINP
jgi:hypothetical protein